MTNFITLIDIFNFEGIPMQDIVSYYGNIAVLSDSRLLIASDEIYTPYGVKRDYKIVSKTAPVQLKTLKLGENHHFEVITRENPLAKWAV
jgi:hypothetical protein